MFNITADFDLRSAKLTTSNAELKLDTVSSDGHFRSFRTTLAGCPLKSGDSSGMSGFFLNNLLKLQLVD